MGVTIHAPFPYTYRYLNLRFIKGCKMYLKLETLNVDCTFVCGLDIEWWLECYFFSCREVKTLEIPVIWPSGKAILPLEVYQCK